MAEVNVVMLGGKRVGKSTILASIIDAFNNSAELSSHLACQDKTLYENYSGFTISQKLENLQKFTTQRSDSGLFMTQTMGDSKIQKYSISVRLPDRPGQLIMDFYDVPGEFANPAKLEFESEMIPLIRECDVFVVAIDTPYLMESTKSVNRAYNRVGDLEVALQNIILKDEKDIKQILLVPVKCEKWSSEGRIKEVIDRVKTEYEVLIKSMSAYEGMNISILPIDTIGGISFHSFYDATTLKRNEEILSFACRTIQGNRVYLSNGNEFEVKPPFSIVDDPQSVVDGIKIPHAWYFKNAFGAYRPKNCEQPALHILRFLVRKTSLYQAEIENATGFSGFLRNLYNCMTNWWKGLEYDSFRKTISHMESCGLIIDKGECVEIIHRCKKWEETLC